MHAVVNPYPVRDAMRMPAYITTPRRGRWCWECDRLVSRRPSWADAMRDLAESAELDRLVTVLRGVGGDQSKWGLLTFRARCRVCRDWSPTIEVVADSCWDRQQWLATVTRDVAYWLAGWSQEHAATPRDETSGKLLPSTAAQWAHLGLRVSHLWSTGGAS